MTGAVIVSVHSIHTRQARNRLTSFPWVGNRTDLAVASNPTVKRPQASTPSKGVISLWTLKRPQEKTHGMHAYWGDQMQTGDETIVRLPGRQERRAVITGDAVSKNCWRCRYIEPDQRSHSRWRHGLTVHTIAKSACQLNWQAQQLHCGAAAPATIRGIAKSALRRGR